MVAISIITIELITMRIVIATESDVEEIIIDIP
mgnify:CR=1 FL=1